MSNVVPIFANEALEPGTLLLLGKSYDSAAKSLAFSAPLSRDEQNALAFFLLGLVRSGVKDADLLALKALDALGEK